jgi:hypothetical protein
MTAYDSTSFSAGQATGTRLAACVARLAALELTESSRWWNRRRHRLMAGALVACAEELECDADRHGRRDAAEQDGEPVLRPALVLDPGSEGRAGASQERLSDRA